LQTTPHPRASTRHFNAHPGSVWASHQPSGENFDERQTRQHYPPAQEKTLVQTE
jgi:hypothetical protein